MAASPSTEFESVSDHLKHAGRAWMAWIFIILRLADLGLFYFAWHPENPMAVLRGVAVGGAIWTTVLIVCVWQRRAWARYFLIAVLVFVIALFLLALLRLLSDPIRNDFNLMTAGFVGILFYAFCIVPLSRSRAILRLSTALGGGQR